MVMVVGRGDVVCVCVFVVVKMAVPMIVMMIMLVVAVVVVMSVVTVVIAVMVAMGVMIRVVFIPDVDLQVDRADAVALHAPGRDAVLGRDAYGRQRLLDAFQRGPQVDRGAQEHVAGDPAKRIDVQVCTHARHDSPPGGPAPRHANTSRMRGF
jgi:hypothetical protein